MLTDDRIRELYKQATSSTLWPEWRQRYEALLARVEGLPDAELLTPGGQKLLWTDTGITGLGQGEVKVDGAFSDGALAAEIVALRARQWPTSTAERAKAMSDEYDRILARVVPRHSKVRPLARLTRIFAVLLPGDFHCVFHWGHREVRRMLVGDGLGGDHAVGGHVLVRARLRSVLGEEKDLSEQVERSVFCWWLFENREAILRGAQDFSPIASEPDLAPPLELWPFSKQRKGLAAVTRLSECYRDVVRAALEGAEVAEVVETLGAEPDYQQHSISTRRSLISTVKSVGLLEVRADRLNHPTEYGLEFLETGSNDVLVELLLVRYFPFACLLRRLHDDGPTEPARLMRALQESYPRWTTLQAPMTAISWVRHLGLVELEDKKLQLTEFGQAWHKRLPEKLPLPDPDEFETDDDVVEPEAMGEAREWPPLDAILQRFGTDSEGKGFVIDRDQLEGIHAAWHCNPKKRFVIISGLSGTGKTAILACYARIYCELLGVPARRHVQLVPVAPDWREPSGMLGYYNPLHEEPTFQIEPALRLLMDAAEDPANPYFLLLDEMNLARVERYFAPLLSAMETGHELVLHGGDEPVNGVPPRIRWPRNLFIGGTVNMDETTHPFSDKVLDRAFTFEFWNVDLPRFFARRQVRNERVEKVLLSLYECLLPIRRHFGYRTAQEILAFVGQGSEGSQEKLLDQAIFSKVLPRLRGEDSERFQAALHQAREICANEKLRLSERKLEEMTALLAGAGITKFWA